MLINMGRFFYFRCCIGITKDISWLHILLVQRTFLQGPFHIVNGRPLTSQFPAYNGRPNHFMTLANSLDLATTYFTYCRPLSV